MESKIYRQCKNKENERWLNKNTVDREWLRKAWKGRKEPCKFMPTHRQLEFWRQIQLLCSWHNFMYHSFHRIRELSGSHVQAEDIFGVSSIQDNHWILIWITIVWYKSESQGWRIDADVQENLCPEECVESIARITCTMTLEYCVEVINSLPR